MSRICQSCGGIVGRDCFNTVECAMITSRMENGYMHYDRRQQSQDAHELYQLQQRFEQLLVILNDHGIDISGIITEVTSEGDNLPY